MLFLTVSLFLTVLFSNESDAKICRSFPKIDQQSWNKYDQEFSSNIHSSWKEFTKGEVSPAQFATNYNAMLASFLESKVEFQEDVKEFFKHNPP